MKTKVAVIGSGNIGTDLMIKVLRLSDTLEMGAMVGIDPASDGLARAKRLGVPVTAEGVQGLIAMDGFEDIKIVFDATSAKAHIANAHALAPYGKQLIDLTPAAIGPMVIPAVNLAEHVGADNVNMVTCGGQATIPVVAAISSVAPVPYAEIVASIASKSAGPGTRAKAIIILNPAEPPLIMRDTVLALVDAPDEATHDAIRTAVAQRVDEVSAYVPGYRLKQQVQIIPVPADQPVHTLTRAATTHQVSVFLEVEGAAHYLPAYAGNLDIMTSAALRMADAMAARATELQGAGA